MIENQTPPDQAALLKRVCDQALQRFRGKTPSRANARRAEIAIHHAVKSKPELADFHQMAPAVVFNDGVPSVFFFPLSQSANAA